MTQRQTQDLKAPVQYGVLAEQYGEHLELQILQSRAGFYLGTFSESGPYTRESREYWNTKVKAQKAFDTGRWTQRTHL